MSAPLTNGQPQGLPLPVTFCDSRLAPMKITGLQIDVVKRE